MGGGRGAVRQWAACVCVCVCCVCLGWAGLQAGPPSLLLGLHCASPHCHQAWWISSQPWSLRVLPPTVDAAWSSAAFTPSARAFKHFPTAPLISITHGAPQAFRRHKQDFKPTAWQVSACPSSLTPVGGWLAQKLFSSAACGAGEQILAAWSGAQGSSSARPRSPIPFCKEQSLCRSPRPAYGGETESGVACWLPWLCGTVLGSLTAFERLLD